MRASMRNERGSAVILAVMAMLIMGVLSISFALLADIESRVGINYKQQAQAEALAEAGLERARDAVRTAPAVAGGFTNWLNGTTANHALFSNVALGPGSFSARIDNDCAPEVVPNAIKEPNHGAGLACNNTADYNEVAVITAWATSGSGRSRVRAIVGVDNPWKHVCSDAKPDNNGYCNEPGNRNGSPTVNPADPNDPNGPQAYNDLPYPILGCSRIDPEVHRTYGGATLGPLVNTARCAGTPMYRYSSPYPALPAAGGPRLVIMGEEPAAGGKTCNADPGGAAHPPYFGYFDCALSTPCPAAEPLCVGGRKACVYATDTRVASDPTNYWPNNAPGGCGANTGMVWTVNANFGQTVGSQTQQYTMYVMGNWIQANNRQMYGTLVVEGTEVGGTVFQVGNGANTELWVGANQDPTPAGWCDPVNVCPHYGFPVVALVYNPYMAAPTIQPTYAPQNITADFGSANTQIHGMIYSGGHVQFNPLSFDGTVVAFEIQTQGSATYTYNPYYGNQTPPPAFPLGGGNQVVVIRKSFMVCSSYSDDAGAPTNCN